MTLFRARRSVIIVSIAISLICFGLLIPKIALVFRIFGRHAGYRQTQETVQMGHDARLLTQVKPRPEVVPRIIHQIYHNWDNPEDEALPAQWLEARKSIYHHNPDYEYKLWNISSSRQFLSDEYPWILETYDAFPYPIQRVDVLRYFLLRHFGGIYMDLDDGCTANLDGTLYYPAWVVESRKGPLMNNIMGGEPNHPFWVMLTENIIPHARQYRLPYFTVRYATGQWYETIMWQKYHLERPKTALPLTRINLDHKPSKQAKFQNTNGTLATGLKHNRNRITIWKIGAAKTWHDWDGPFLSWVEDYLRLAFQIGWISAIVLSGLRAIYYAWQIREIWLPHLGHMYQRLKGSDEEKGD